MNKKNVKNKLTVKKHDDINIEPNNYFNKVRDKEYTNFFPFNNKEMPEADKVKIKKVKPIKIFENFSQHYKKENKDNKSKDNKSKDKKKFNKNKKKK